MRCAAMVMAVLVALGLCWAAPTAASAKSKGKSCAAAEAAFLATGQGDRDGDGLSDCRERRQLGTLMDDADSDDDGMSDGEEMTDRCDPMDSDSDDDGIEDGDDDTPGIPEQKLKAFVDALTCPQVGVPGSITALGVTVALDDHTEFEEVACDAIAMLLATPGSSVFAEIEILEDSSGALTATEVELEGEHDDDDDGDDEGDDD